MMEAKKEKRKKRNHILSWYLNGGIAILIICYGTLVGTIGIVCIVNTIMQQYESNTYNMAESAVQMINGDSLEDYLNGEKQEEYEETKRNLNDYFLKMDITTIYVIRPQASDFTSFVTILNLVNNEVDDTNYKTWELGYVQKQTKKVYVEGFRYVYSGAKSHETLYRVFKRSTPHPHITSIVPVYDSSGDTVALFCMQRPMRELKMSVLPYFFTIVISAMILACVSYYIAGKHNKKHFVVPLKKILDESVRFAKENTKGEALGDISKIEEISDLALSIDKMETDTLNYIDNLTKVTSEKERMSTELSVATSIQATAIPDKFPAFPDRTEFDLYGSMTPAREVGGDFYNFQMIDDDHLAMIIGDVSGKGVPAALFMMMANILFISRSQSGGSPSDILEYMNENICKNNEKDMFVTCWLGILDIKTGKITASNAGHEYPAIMHNGRYQLLKDKHHFVVGGMKGSKYSNYELVLEPGDRLFVYSDGVPESTRSDDEMFGTSRMLKALNECADLTLKNTVESVRSSIDEFVEGAEQFDDLTMLCLEYIGN